MNFAFFLEMAWKSALIAGAALLLVSLLRGRSPAERGAVLRIGVAMLLLLPAIALGLPALQVEAWTADAVPVAYMPPPELLTYVPSAAPLAVEQPTIWDDPTILFVILYGGGLLMASLRLFAGLWTLRRWTAAASPVEAPEWLAGLARARAAMPSRRSVRLLVSDELSSPLSWGWARPVIMIDRDTLHMSEDAEAILAHEWAHVVRQDWPVLMLARTVSALFWFNPLVWMLEREIVQQAEEAADGFAARSVEPARYAQTLVKWAQFGTHGLPANSMAPATAALARRVRAILEGAPRAGQARSAATMAAMALCATFAAALAALELVPAQARAAETPAPAPVRIARAEVAPLTPPAPAASPAPATPAPAPAPRLARTPVAAEAAPRPPEAPAAPAKSMAPRPAPRPAPPGLEELQRMQPQIAVAIRDARRTGQVVGVRIDDRRIEREVERAVRAAERNRERGDHGARHGTVHVDRSARGLAAAAARLRDPAHRERAIVRARSHGKTITHEQLIEMAEALEEGAADHHDDGRESRGHSEH